MKLCSVIVPSYNYSSCIEVALNSIRNQTYQNIELIIVDDGSTDNSVAVIENFIKSCNFPTKLLFHPGRKNLHLVETYKLGLQEARGEYVAFLEADDYWHPEKLEKCINVLDSNSEVSLVFSDCEIVSELKESPQKDYIDSLRIKLEELNNPFYCKTHYLNHPSFNLVPSFSSVVTKKELLHKLSFETEHKPWLDCWLWAQLAFHGPFYFINEKLFGWRVHLESCNSKFMAAQDDIDEYRAIFERDLLITLTGIENG